MKYKVIPTKRPVAKFYYQGSHTHPVRRTILVTEETSKYLTGYELREGNETRKLRNAPVKRYSKANIARFGDYCRLRMSQKNQDRLDNESTLERRNYFQLALEGV